jgi:hypothetical protein
LLRPLTEGSIDLSHGRADPLKGPTDLGTARAADEEVALSSLIDKLNERFGTDITEADQLFFDQIRASAETDEKIVEVAKANNLANFSSYLDRMLTRCRQVFFLHRPQSAEIRSSAKHLVNSSGLSKNVSAATVNFYR